MAEAHAVGRRPLRLFAASVLLLGISCGGEEGRAASGDPGRQVFRNLTRVSYEYEGTLGIVGVPSAAVAYSGESVAARARVLFDGELSPGSLRTLDVEETHYDAAGSIVYRGRILFEIASSRGYRVAGETSLSGDRPLRAFADWPSSN